MAQRSGGNIRMGIVSFITLVSILLLAVLSVLCIVTANATNATAERQASSTTGLYAVDSAGQRCLAAIDGYLAQSKEAGESAQAAVKRITSDADGTLAGAVKAAGQDDEALTYTVDGSDATIELVIAHRDGRKLHATIAVGDDLESSANTWKTSTTQTVSSSSLWSGATQADSDVSASSQPSDNE